METLNQEQVFPTCVKLKTVHSSFRPEEGPVNLKVHLFFQLTYLV